MSQRTVANESYKGLLEAVSIPADVVEKNGRKYATCRGAVPIHCCDEEQVKIMSVKTHHYCDIFTEEVIAPLDELAFVRIDEATSEKVFINRSKRILLTSSDGVLAQWRAAPTFESSNQYIAGAPVYNKGGALVSVITVKRGNHYAVSCIEGDGGYFDTSEPWTTKDVPESGVIYGDQIFDTREAVKKFVASLDPATSNGPARPVLWRATQGARIALVAPNGRQLAHYYIHNVISQGVEYL